MAKYTEKDLEKVIKEINNRDNTKYELAKAAAKQHVDALVKPPRSMGKLEDIAVKLAGITGCVVNRANKKTIFALCADNGVIEEGVASSPLSVTASQAVNMTKSVTGMSAIAKDFDCKVKVVDVGIKSDYSCDAIINRRLMNGTGNITKEPAMSRDICIDAIMTGIKLAAESESEAIMTSTEHGLFDLIGIGEMGVGNTTTSTAVLAALTGNNSDALVGRGAGLTDEGFIRKKNAIRKALDFHGLPNADADTIGIISRVGGLDIAAMCGVFIGAALNRKAAVIDGLISAVAALCAVRLCPSVSDYLFPSHASKEPAYALAISELGMSPWLNLNMGLGEGVGCPMAFMVIEAACAMMNNMATFSEGGIDDSYLEEIR